MAETRVAPLKKDLTITAHMLRHIRTSSSYHLKGGRLVDLATFYQISLVSDLLEDKVASALIEHLLHHPSGIYACMMKSYQAPADIQVQTCQQVPGRHGAVSRV